jgi:hypothetical protein
MKPKLSITLLVLLILISCRRSHDKSNDPHVFNVSFDQCNDYIDLKLSDLIEDCKLVSLETTEESLLHQNPRIFTVLNNIIIGDRNGFYKFSNEGKFERKLIASGRGPLDLPQIYTSFVNEKRNQILINDRDHNHELIVYDYEAEKFLDPVKKAVPGYWGSFSVYNDSLILASLDVSREDTTLYELFLQNFKGKLFAYVNNERKMISLANKEMVQRLVICKGSSDILVSYIYDDTLFRYNQNQLSPYLIVSYNSSRSFTRGLLPKEGESRVHFPAMDNPSFMLLPEVIFSNNRSDKSEGLKVKYTQNLFFLNKANGSFSKIRTYTDNITGEVLNGSEDLPIKSNGTLFPLVMPGEKIVVLYEANILKNTNFTAELLQGMPTGTTKKLYEIQKNLDKMNNPMLLIGTIKKNIKIPE